MEGEGSRERSRRFQSAQHAFAQTGDVEGKAKKAARALESDEAEEPKKLEKPLPKRRLRTEAGRRPVTWRQPSGQTAWRSLPLDSKRLSGFCDAKRIEALKHRSSDIGNSFAG